VFRATQQLQYLRSGLTHRTALRANVVKLRVKHLSLPSFLTWLVVLGLCHSRASWATLPADSALAIEEPDASHRPPTSAWQKEILLEPKTIKPSSKTLRTRLEAEKQRPEISEPVVLRLKTTELRPLLAQLASDKVFKKLTTVEEYSFLLMKNLENRLERRSPQNQNVNTKATAAAFLTLRSSDLEWIDLEKLSTVLSYPSLEPYIAMEELRELQKSDPAAILRWQTHFGARFDEMREKVSRWLTADANALQMPVSALLPDHMKNLLGRYSPFRGRNCFATALQFAEPNIIQTKNINMMREAGHSLALINHDEFSHALWLGYDELTQQQLGSGLKFGDVIVVIDASEGTTYSSFKHAAVHMAGDIYFHKPSKSASTPIEFARWKDIVQTWKPLVKQLDFRFFRPRPGVRLQGQNPSIAIEKIKWNR